MEAESQNGAAYRAPAAKMQLVHTAVSESGVNCAYVFVNPDGAGYRILSADDIAVPVLGYSDSGTFDPQNIPVQLKGLLETYGRQIEYAVSKGLGSQSDAKPYAPAAWEAIAPLMTTTWGQDSPYNYMTPAVGSTPHAPTGCVATSFAQVMNYFKYPEKGTGTIKYSLNGVQMTLRLDRQAFDWDNMLDSYPANGYTDAQRDAVAYLMKACGYAVEMGYGAYSSGAMSYKLANAAVTYFKYDSNIQYFDRNYFTYDQWAQKIYDNLRFIGPVICDGRSIDGGHSFVCDGYDGNGYFHYNWGWDGMSNGYYLIDSLSPEAQGTGGSEGGFNYGQSALFGMQKPTGEPGVTQYPVMKIMGTVGATATGNKVWCKATGIDGAGWGTTYWKLANYNIGAFVTKVGAEMQQTDLVQGIMSADGSSGPESISLNANSYYPATGYNPLITIPSNLPDGEYKLTVASKDADSNEAPWQPVITTNGNLNYCYITKNGNSVTVRNVSPLELQMEAVSLISPLYYGRNACINTVIKNPTDRQLTLCYSPVLCTNGTVNYQGDMMLLTVDANSQLDKQTLVRFYAVDSNQGLGDFELRILNRETGKLSQPYGTYTMETTSSGYTLEVEDFSVANSPQENVTVGSREFKNTYIVPSGEDAVVNLQYNVKTGYFDSSIRLNLGQYDPATNKITYSETNLYYDTPFLGTGESKSVSVPVSWSTLEPGVMYAVKAVYMVKGQSKNLGLVYFTANTSGVEGISGDFTEETPVYFNLQGQRVANPAKGDLLIERTSRGSRKVIF